MMTASTDPKGLRILGYGIETKGLPFPERKIASEKYTIEFADYKGAARFQDFDGVIVFQGTFESFTLANDGYSRGFLKHKWDRDELDKRTKEALALLDKGGFACLMLRWPSLVPNSRAAGRTAARSRMHLRCNETRKTRRARWPASATHTRVPPHSGSRRPRRLPRRRQPVDWKSPRRPKGSGGPADRSRSGAARRCRRATRGAGSGALSPGWASPCAPILAPGSMRTDCS